MKKTISIALMTLLVFSAFPVLAQERNIEATNIEQSTERYNLARDAFTENSKKHFDKTTQLLEIKKQKHLACAASVTNAINTSICKAKTEELRLNSKELMLTSADLVIAYLQQLKEKTQMENSLTEVEATTLIEGIDIDISEITAIKESIQEATTSEQLITALSALKLKISDLKQDKTSYVSTLKSSRIGLIVQRANQLEKKLDAILVVLKERNLMTQEIEVLVAQFKDKIAKAKESHTEAIQLLKEAKLASSNTERAKLQKEAHLKIREAQQYLQDAHAILTKIVNTVRDITGNKNLEVNYQQGIIRERLRPNATLATAD